VLFDRTFLGERPGTHKLGLEHGFHFINNARKPLAR
jgi:hypothetical protein